METRTLICIGCPLGCPLTVTLKDGKLEAVCGNTCPKGDAYARKEVTNPTRILTTTLRVCASKTGAVTVPCKTASDVPKEKLFDCVRAIAGLTVEAPVCIGDVLKADLAGTGVDLVATKDIR